MAMTLAIPASVPSPASSDDLASIPRTPITPPSIQTLSLPDSSSQTSQQQTNAAAATTQKRKPSRRANTAERRATHNAVERQRRETLNGRFLDLAALLPNLSQIRRPSKSSIVNSSIAHIHASRRHRMLAARELRSLKLEADALRRELNKWRDRAAIPRVEEPLRGEGFAMVMSGELEVLTAIADEDEDQDGEGYDGDDYIGGGMGGGMDEIEDHRHAMLKNANAGLFGVTTPSSAHPMMVSIPRGPGPMIATSPSNVSFENPAMAALYEPHPQGAPAAHFANGHFIQQHQHLENDKVAAWNPQLYTQMTNNNNGNPNNAALQQQQQMMQQQQRLYTPPHTQPHHVMSPAATDAAFFANFQRQQQQMIAMQQQQQQQLIYGGSGSSDGGDDASSVGSGSGSGGRARSGSLTGSGYGSPVHNGSPASYEINSGPGPEYVSRRLSANLHVNTNVGFDGMGMIKSMPMSAGHVGSFML